ncbi:MAG: thioredoxin domain-containing protein [Hyphomicrobium sp.]|nr:thioredoxin domain-containing protein [Hyphomicrobium sp.]
MTENRLQFETSPYLLQHKDNPVHWWAWGPDALAEAKRTGKPILLSVGYAACHWCHVMAHESFEDAGTAEVMNGLYINIKVDREERPDIDAIYMGALHRLGEQGGWPLTMFLDSDARPFWGGTYFPKDARYGRPTFVTVLMRIAEAFQNQPENVANNAERLIESLREQPARAGLAMPGETQIRDLVRRISNAVDREHGGLSGAPKFPQWNVFWLLWRGAIRFDDDAARQAVLTTLTHICQGGIYDHLGGGFSRYSVDDRWLVPHFEKMLYDNALLIDLLTEAWRDTQDPLYAERIAETVDWLRREMIAEGGGFAASLDADSEGEEGKFYVWGAAEIDAVLGADDAAFFAAVYDVTQGGNFEGHTILNRLGSLAPLSAENETRLALLRAKLLTYRTDRVRPGWDDKVLADWNGLMIAALSRAAVMFSQPEWLACAKRAFDFVVAQQSAGDGRLWHSYRSGQAKAPATASDYANMTWAAIRLFEATGDGSYLELAQRWTATLKAHHWDGARGGYFTAADDTLDVIVRLKTAADDAVPSANAIQLWNLIALSAISGDTAYDDDACELLAAFGGVVADSPVGHCGLLAASLDLDAILQIKVEEGTAGSLSAVLKFQSVPGALEFVALQTRQLGVAAQQDNSKGAPKGNAIICRGKICSAPIFDADAFAQRLRNLRRSAGASIS